MNLFSLTISPHLASEVDALRSLLPPLRVDMSDVSMTHPVLVRLPEHLDPLARTVSVSRYVEFEDPSATLKAPL